jgi:hypothetical protein
MQILIHFVGALILAYFISRVILLLPLAVRRIWGLLLAHAITLALCLALVAAARAPMQAFAVQQLGELLAAQGFWLLFDLLRKVSPRLRIPG